MSEATGPAGAGQGLTELRRSVGGAVLAPADEGFDAGVAASTRWSTIGRR
jgi:hypothetical protein